MRIARTVLALILVIGFASMLDAQALRQGGMIRGVITDKGGEGLPGVAVTTSSPALIGKITDVSGGDGSYRLPSLPPGTYIVTAELSGFKMMKREGVVVRVGQVIAINFTTEPSAINEEIQVTATSPVVDVQSLKISTRVDAEALSKLPLGRQFANIIAVTPGIIEDFSSEKMTGMGTGEMHGGTAYSNAFEVDGVGVNDPAHNASILFTPQYDAIEEVDIETGGLSAAVGNTGGNFINVVTKSGGNTFHGTLNAYYHSEDLVQSLYQPEQLKARLAEVAKLKAGHQAAQSVRGLVVVVLEQALCFTADPKASRHELQKWLTGYESLTQAPDPVVMALYAWLKPSKDSGGTWSASSMAAREAAAAYRVAAANCGDSG